MTQLKAQCTVTGGNPDLGITNTFGYAAISIALDAQRRDVSNKNHDIAWRGFNFDGIDIYADPLAPSAAAQNYIPLAPSNPGQGNANLQDGVGSSTQTVSFTTPQFFQGNVPIAFSPTYRTFLRTPLFSRQSIWRSWRRVRSRFGLRTRVDGITESAERRCRTTCPLMRSSCACQRTCTTASRSTRLTRSGSTAESLTTVKQRVKETDFKFSQKEKGQCRNSKSFPFGVD